LTARTCGVAVVVTRYTSRRHHSPDGNAQRSVIARRRSTPRITTPSSCTAVLLHSWAILPPHWTPSVLSWSIDGARIKEPAQGISSPPQRLAPDRLLVCTDRTPSWASGRQAGRPMWRTNAMVIGHPVSEARTCGALVLIDVHQAIHSTAFCSCCGAAASGMPEQALQGSDRNDRICAVRVDVYPLGSTSKTAGCTIAVEPLHRTPAPWRQSAQRAPDPTSLAPTHFSTRALHS
jgi:hypothetical protein